MDPVKKMALFLKAIASLFQPSGRTNVPELSPSSIEIKQPGGPKGEIPPFNRPRQSCKASKAGTRSTPMQIDKSNQIDLVSPIKEPAQAKNRDLWETINRAIDYTHFLEPRLRSSQFGDNNPLERQINRGLTQLGLDMSDVQVALLCRGHRRIGNNMKSSGQTAQNHAGSWYITSQNEKWIDGSRGALNNVLRARDLLLRARRLLFRNEVMNGTRPRKISVA